MIGPLATLTIALLALAGLSKLRGYRPWERKLIKYALWAHFAGSLALIAIYKYYYGGGDLLLYQRIGGYIAAHLSRDFGDIFPRLLALLFQTGGTEIVPYSTAGSTGSMHALSAILSYLFGDSLLASSFFIASAAFYGKVAIYSVLRRELSAEFHRPALIGSLLVPSAVFWSGSLLKESVAMSFLGALIWGGYSVVATRSKVSGAISLGVGVIGCALFKAYLLVPTAVAGMVWLYVRRAVKTRSIFAKPIYLGAAAAAVLGLLLVIGNLYPRYDVFRAQKQLVEEAKTMGTASGGSDYTLLDTAGPSSTLKLLVTSPFAVFTALLRPAIIEARNPLSLANGLETLILTIMLYRVIRRRGFWASVGTIRKSPILSFCTVFTLLLALGVGFATTNMGTLSRYRMPLIPFFVVVLGVLGTKPRVETIAKTRNA